MKGVLGEFPRDTWHVFGAPCENVPILTEEIDERAFLFAVQAVSDQDELAWVFLVQQDLPCSLRGIELRLSSRFGLSNRFGLSSRHVLLQSRHVLHYDALLFNNDHYFSHLRAV